MSVRGPIIELLKGGGDKEEGMGDLEHLQANLERARFRLKAPLIWRYKFPAAFR